MFEMKNAAPFKPGPNPTSEQDVDKPICIDLFAGAGGFSLAALQAGYSVAAAVEINKHACTTYTHNLVTPAPEKERPELLESDILKEDVGEKLREILQRKGKPCDIVLGGPPCQGFSVHRIKDAGVDDPRNALILRYFELVQTLSPKAFLMENVPGILWSRHKKWLDQFYIQGRKAGYHLYDCKVLDARDYGVPQRRRRVFILGIRNDISRDSIVWPPPKTHAKQGNLKDNLKTWVPAKTIFEKAILKNDINNKHMQHSEALVEVFRNTPKNGGSRSESGRILPCHINHSGHKDVYGRIRLNEPGPTMTTACINPSKGRFVHPTEDHGITIRHAARFQTFPDDFVFQGGLIAAGVQVGNAVPVALGKVLLTHLALTLNLPVYQLDEKSPR